MNKSNVGDGIPAELFQILKDDAFKVLRSICQQIWKTQQWPQASKRSVFIQIPKSHAKECSNYHANVVISLAIFSFLEEISSLPHSIVFLYFFILLRKLFFFLISPCYFWDSAFKWVYHSLSPLPFTSLLSQLFVKPPQTIILPFCISFS